MARRIERRIEKGDQMATRLLGATLNLLSVRDVLNARAAGESPALARDVATKQRALLTAVLPLDPIDERSKAAAAKREAERQRKAEKQQEKARSPESCSARGAGVAKARHRVKIAGACG
jgi:hypothetical protein